MHEPIPKAVIKFLNDQKVLTLATSNNGVPYCCNCFYVYQNKLNAFLFKSDENTFHIQNALKHNKVSGTVYYTRGISKIQGVQFSGLFLPIAERNLEDSNNYYHKKFPFASLKPAPLWQINLTFLKMTHTNLGITKKTKWKHKDHVEVS